MQLTVNSGCCSTLSVIQVFSMWFPHAQHQLRVSVYVMMRHWTPGIVVGFAAIHDSWQGWLIGLLDRLTSAHINVHDYRQMCYSQPGPKQKNASQHIRHVRTRNPIHPAFTLGSTRQLGITRKHRHHSIRLNTTNRSEPQSPKTSRKISSVPTIVSPLKARGHMVCTPQPHKQKKKPDKTIHTTPANSLTSASHEVTHRPQTEAGGQAAGSAYRP